MSELHWPSEANLDSGDSALAAVVRNRQYDLLCPEGVLAYVECVPSLHLAANPLHGRGFLLQRQFQTSCDAAMREFACRAWVSGLRGDSECLRLRTCG